MKESKHTNYTDPVVAFVQAVLAAGREQGCSDLHVETDLQLSVGTKNHLSITAVYGSNKNDVTI